MRIAIVNPFHYPYFGGIEHRIHHISKRLASRHEVIVVTGKLPETKEYEEVDGYHIKRLPSSYLNIYNPPMIWTKGIDAALRELKPDVIDLHYRWARGYTKPVVSQNTAKVLTWHNAYGEGVGLLRPLSIINDMLFSRKRNGFQRIVCISNFVARDLISRGFPAEKLSIVPNGVDLPPDERLNKEEDFILFIGRLVGTKGLPYLIEAMRYVDEELIICGTGPDRNRLESLVRKFKLEKKITFLGKVSEEKKHDLLSRCKIFVMPSLIESYGIAAAEGMAYGKPVVGSKTGGLPDVIGEAGILVEPRNARELASSINALLANENLRRDLGRKARERAKEFSWDRAAEMMERIYVEVSSNAS
ncbi:MAG: glycosyltransferase family 4 protein [Methanomassiliicoccales archaeon]|nr:glycosyltransferase family 4 protein [Methanomassiliicoccales archaeon]